MQIYLDRSLVRIGPGQKIALGPFCRQIATARNAESRKLTVLKPRLGADAIFPKTRREADGVWIPQRYLLR